jgi:peptide/nickel transport system permease protein
MKIEILKLLIKRLLTSVVVIFLLVTFIFILIRLAPGEPSQKFITPQLSPELANLVSKSFGLDEPIHIQYFSFIKNVVSGDFGISYNYRQPVLTVIKDYFLFTLVFAIISLLIQLGLSYLLAKAAFKRAGGLIDKTLSKLSIILYAIPSFVLGLVLVFFFSVQLNFLPTSGIKSIYHDDFSTFGKIFDYLKHAILPMITLSLAGVAVFYKYMRDSLDDVVSQPFILNLKASGVTQSKIFHHHILPNALRPIISVAGIEFGILLGGALITEVIFSLPGMGRLTVNAIYNRDFPLIIGCSFISGAMMIISNLIADLIKIKIDKRLIKDLIK